MLHVFSINLVKFMAQKQKNDSYLGREDVSNKHAVV
jgi:hypothetical protein